MSRKILSFLTITVILGLLLPGCASSPPPIVVINEPASTAITVAPGDNVVIKGQVTAAKAIDSVQLTVGDRVVDEVSGNGRQSVTFQLEWVAEQGSYVLGVVAYSGKEFGNTAILVNVAEATSTPTPLTGTPVPGQQQPPPPPPPPPQPPSIDVNIEYEVKVEVNQTTIVVVVDGVPQPPIVVPTRCVVSPPAGWRQYIVQQGNTLWTLSGRTSAGLADVIRANCIVNPNLIYVGQILWLPSNSPAFWTPTPTFTPKSTATPTPTPTATRPPDEDLCRAPDLNGMGPEGAIGAVFAAKLFPRLSPVGQGKPLIQVPEAGRKVDCGSNVDIPYYRAADEYGCAGWVRRVSDGEDMKAIVRAHYPPDWEGWATAWIVRNSSGLNLSQLKVGDVLCMPPLPYGTQKIVYVQQGVVRLDGQGVEGAVVYINTAKGNKAVAGTDKRGIYWVTWVGEDDPPKSGDAYLRELHTSKEIEPSAGDLMPDRIALLAQANFDLTQAKWSITLIGGVKTPQHLPLAGAQVCFCVSGETQGSCGEWRCATTKDTPAEKRGIYEVSYASSVCQVPSQYKVEAPGWVKVEGPMPSLEKDCSQQTLLFRLDPLTMVPEATATLPIWVNFRDAFAPLSGEITCVHENYAQEVKIAVGQDGRGYGEISVTSQTSNLPILCRAQANPPGRYWPEIARASVEEASYTIRVEFQPVWTDELDKGLDMLEFAAWRNGWTIEDGPARVEACTQDFPGGTMVYHSEVQSWGDATIYVLWKDGTFMYGADERTPQYNTGLDWYRAERMTQDQRDRLGKPMVSETCQALDFNWFASAGDQAGRVFYLIWPHPKWPSLLVASPSSNTYSWYKFRIP